MNRRFLGFLLIALACGGGILWIDYNEQSQPGVSYSTAPGVTPQMREQARYERCLWDGVMVDTFLKGQDEVNYRKWKSTQARDCRGF